MYYVCGLTLDVSVTESCQKLESHKTSYAITRTLYWLPGWQTDRQTNGRTMQTGVRRTCVEKAMSIEKQRDRPRSDRRYWCREPLDSSSMMM